VLPCPIASRAGDEQRSGTRSADDLRDSLGEQFGTSLAETDGDDY
jgi:hypothetical protein